MQEPLEAAWTASNAFIEFSLDMYADMVEDTERTAGFERAIQRRLRGREGELVVLDLGTGPFAILALFAARAGARKVYAVEANAAAAERARASVASAVFNGDIASGAIEVIEGFSTAISLPELADLVVAEISGSIASEEGMCHSMRDARLRHLARPEDPGSYIPMRCQTLAVPASYSLNHRSATDEDALMANAWPMHDVPEAGDGAGEAAAVASGEQGEYRCILDIHSYVGVGPIRLRCNDPWMLALSTPQLWEDFAFATDDPGDGNQAGVTSCPLVFEVEAATFAANGRRFAEQLEAQGVGAEVAAAAGAGAASSLSGIACWPRLVLDEGTAAREGGGGGGGGGEAAIVVESRGRAGEPRFSHWQTVLPLGAPATIRPGDSISVELSVELEAEIDSPPRYEFKANITGAD